MGHSDPGFLVVGRIVKAHGIKGEFIVRPFTDYPESTFAPGVSLLLGNTQSEGPDLTLSALELEQARPHKDGYIVSVAGISDRNYSELLRGRYLFRDVAALEPLADGQLFHYQLLGMKVQTSFGQMVGEVTEVYELNPNDILCVQGPGGEIMIPFSKDIVIEVDADKERIVVDPPDGLLDL